MSGAAEVKRREPAAGAAPTRSRGTDDESLGAHLSELLGLVLAYAKQETLVPIKNLRRYVAWGVAGAVLLAVGGAMLTFAAVRAVQAETGRHLQGHLTWVPYTAGIIIAAAMVSWAALKIVRGER